MMFYILAFTTTISRKFEGQSLCMWPSSKSRYVKCEEYVDIPLGRPYSVLITINYNIHLTDILSFINHAFIYHISDVTKHHLTSRNPSTSSCEWRPYCRLVQICVRHLPSGHFRSTICSSTIFTHLSIHQFNQMFVAMYMYIQKAYYIMVMYILYNYK